jgi:hypothetical protein
MIIQLQSATAENVGAAKRSLEAMAQSWGQEIADAPAEATTAAGTVHDDHDKVIDPVSLATLLVSIPSAALAVTDLADRIPKRRRAKELIDQAQQLADQQVTICVTSRSRTVELRTLDPDQLLDLLADEDPAS